jgi:hypothetical protein
MTKRKPKPPFPPTDEAARAHVEAEVARIYGVDDAP